MVCSYDDDDIVTAIYIIIINNYDADIESKFMYKL